ncbi:MAG: S46 family peptidase [Elusimicrobiota bacterium]
MRRIPASDIGLSIDEGMWTFDNPPRRLLRELYGFAPGKRWLDHARGASVRFNDGGSGSFVSPHGLVLTNHHVAMGQLQKMSTPARNHVRDGFRAPRRSREMRCPDVEIDQLVSMENVTRRVLAASGQRASEAEVNEARKAATARIEGESTEKTGLRSDVVELYQGGEYWLYRYKKYTDVRLVMAPELRAASFGGSGDNFTYPRFSLDFAFFRVYEGGRPARSRRYFPLRPAGPREGEPLFVTGHPGATYRLLTLAQLEFQRDLALPTRLKTCRSRLEAIRSYGARAAEAARRAQDVRLHLENAAKLVAGEHEGLLDPGLFERKAGADRRLRERVAARPELARACRGCWERIAAARRALARRFRPYAFRRLNADRLTGMAGAIVRYVAEVAKPNEKRYEEFRDSALESLRFRLFSPAPLHKDFEEAMLAHGLGESLRELGSGDPFVRAALGGKSPERTAREAIARTRLDKPAVRKALVEGGRAAVESSKDPLIALARRVDGHYRGMRKWYEDNVESVERVNGQRIAKARFALYGKALYPDATYTLRLSHGRAAGYEWQMTEVPFKTTFYGLYDRSDGFDGRPPYDLGKRIAAARGKVELSTPLNFVSTHDIVGGNSGSPIVDRKGRLVGVVFDSNMQALPSDYGYPGGAGRTVSVHAAAILEALRRVYDMPSLARELTRVPPPRGGIALR